MCGICGIYDPRGGIDEGLVRRMNEALHHRGPDADAVKGFDQCVLAYKRLSIIDLDTGFQPMSDESGRCWIVYNGEIYNYKELREGLRSRGHSLVTLSDTEAIVHLYEERGTGSVQDLNGMFAFAIWDAERRSLILARDRLGIKPLYYRLDGPRLAFASEIKGILADPSVPRRLNYQALADYVTFQNVYGDKTFFEGIHLLPPGHILVAVDGRVRLEAYWDLRFSDGTSEPEEAVRQHSALVDESVEMQLMSDVPLGSHLSGGIDSGTVVMKAAQKLADRIKTFSVYFQEPEYDESGLIEQVSILADTIHFDRLLNPGEFSTVLEKIAYHLDEPRVGPSVIPQWCIAELASKHVKVVLTGHGGDELFAGYPSYLFAYLCDVIGRRDVGEIRSIARNLRARLRAEGWERTLGLPILSLVRRDLARYGRDAIFDSRDQGRLLTETTRDRIGEYEPRAELDRVLANSGTQDPLNRVLYLDIKTYLPALLLVEDRVSMAHSLEDRVPLLDHRIAELSSRVPGRFKIRGLVLKWIPRQTAHGLLPRAVLDHRKIGFLVPLREWLRGPLRTFAEELLLSERAARRGIFEPREVRRLFLAHISGSADHSWKLWSLLNVELWHRTWMDRPESTEAA